MHPSLLLIDNFDSFTHNLAHTIVASGGEVTIIRYDRLDPAIAERHNAIVLSPGPGSPADYPKYCEWLNMWEEKPILGVCLGMQIMTTWAGGTVMPHPHPRHGKTSMITHDKGPMWKEIPTPTEVMRYHSLICDIGAAPLTVTAHDDEHNPMAWIDSSRPWWAVQFHPESYRTAHGATLLRHFIERLS